MFFNEKALHITMPTSHFPTHLRATLPRLMASDARVLPKPLKGSSAQQVRWSEELSLMYNNQVILRQNLFIVFTLVIENNVFWLWFQQLEPKPEHSIEQ